MLYTPNSANKTPGEVALSMYKKHRKPELDDMIEQATDAAKQGVASLEMQTFADSLLSYVFGELIEGTMPVPLVRYFIDYIGANPLDVSVTLLQEAIDANVLNDEIFDRLQPVLTGLRNQRAALRDRAITMYCEAVKEHSPELGRQLATQSAPDEDTLARIGLESVIANPYFMAHWVVGSKEKLSCACNNCKMRAASKDASFVEFVRETPANRVIPEAIKRYGRGTPELLRDYGRTLHDAGLTAMDSFSPDKHAHYADSESIDHEEVSEATRMVLRRMQGGE